MTSVFPYFSVFLGSPAPKVLLRHCAGPSLPHGSPNFIPPFQTDSFHANCNRTSRDTPTWPLSRHAPVAPCRLTASVRSVICPVHPELPDVLHTNNGPRIPSSLNESVEGEFWIELRWAKKKKRNAAKPLQPPLAIVPTPPLH